MRENDLHLGIRIPASDKALLLDVCEKRGEGVSSFVRRAIRKELASLSFYSDETKKALGVKIE